MNWHFGPFEADLQEHRLCRGAEQVPLTRKAFTLLAALLARPGQLVTKAELFDSVWAGTVVTEAALSRAIREVRVALGDDATSPRYIATVHGLGFRFVGTLAAETKAVGGAEAAPAGVAGGIVGREHELQSMRDACAAARGGARRVVFVSGEAGIGKTALVGSFIASQGGPAALRVARGHCIEQYGPGEPYLPLLEAFESLSRQTGNAALRELLLRYAPTWLAQLPWLAHDADPQALQRALAGASAQRMLREVAQALDALAADEPLLLWLEDLHWSDHSTLDVVSFLAGRTAPARLLVVCSFRPGEAHERGTPLHALTQQLVQRGHAIELPLASLAAPWVGRYLRLRLRLEPESAVDDLAQFIHARTEGHPLFTVAVVDDLLHRQRLLATAEGARLAYPVDQLGTNLPASLKLLVRRQIEQFDATDRRLVEAAAVAGPDFCAAAVAAALQVDVAEVEERCLRLAAGGRFLRAAATVAWPDGTESAGFSFHHALYWQGSYEAMTPARRAEAQQRIGLREEQAWGADAAQIAGELAMRFEASRDWERCLLYLRLAGIGALARCAYQECAHLLAHALELRSRLPAAERDRTELELLMPLGAAQMALHGYAADEVEQTYRRALALCRGGSARAGELQRVLRGLWNVQLVRARLDAARVAADELLVQAAVQASPGAHFDAFAKQGQTSLHRGEFGAARAQLEHALALPLEDDDATRLRESPRVTAYLGWVLWIGGERQSARARADEAVAIARRAGSAHSIAFALGFSGWLHAFDDDWPGVVRAACQQAEVADEHGLRYWQVWSEGLLGLAAAHVGAGVGAAEAGCLRLARAIDDFLDMGAAVGVPHFLDALADAWLANGKLQQAEEALVRAAALQDHTGNRYHAAEHHRLQGRLRAALHDVDGAARSYAAAATLAREQQAWTFLLRAQASRDALDPARSV